MLFLQFELKMAVHAAHTKKKIFRPLHVFEVWLSSKVLLTSCPVSGFIPVKFCTGHRSNDSRFTNMQYILSLTFRMNTQSCHNHMLLIIMVIFLSTLLLQKKGKLKTFFDFFLSTCRIRLFAMVS